MFSIHGYQTWMPDNPRGYVKSRQVMPPNPQRAEQYRNHAKHWPVLFNDDMLQMMLSGVNDICQRRGWRLHAFGSEPTHIHVIVSWNDETQWRYVRNKITNLLSLFLGRYTDTAGRRWFASKPSRKRIRDHDHLDYLINTYLPGHSRLFWKEGDPSPSFVEQMLPPKKS